jgi:GntR family transcriptional regulator/MocR family aminotransferase
LARTAITGSLIAIELDENSQESIHQQIQSKLRAAIVSGRLPAGIRLPSTRIFAGEIGVSRNTVLQVFEALTEEGLLISRLGAGTFVAELTDGSTGLFANEHRKPEYGGYPFRSLSRRGKSLVASATGEFSERPTPFMPDLPDLREFPIRTWLRLLNETSGRLTGEILADTSNAGYEPLRRAIAQHLNASKGMNCDYTQVIITTGSQQSLDLVCRMLLDVGDPVWLEEPGYIGARSVFAANRR